jgi:hypothetical protein
MRYFPGGIFSSTGIRPGGVRRKKERGTEAEYKPTFSADQ